MFKRDDYATWQDDSVGRSFMSIAGSGSTGVNKFSFLQCLVTSVTPIDAVYSSDLVTITGTNFGSASAALSAQVGLAFGGTYSFTVPDNEFTFAAPLNVGMGLLMQIYINNRACDMSSGTTVLNYGSPEVFPDMTGTLTGPPTNGGLATFIGKGFGPAGRQYVDSV
eukprot:6554176-Pyramimonas_sp.AAC.1